MNCDCKADIEQKILDSYKLKTPEASGHIAALEGYGFVIEADGMKVRGYMPYETAANFTTKKGSERRKVTKGNMFFSYCPFCGEKATA